MSYYAIPIIPRDGQITRLVVSCKWLQVMNYPKIMYLVTSYKIFWK